MDLWIRSQDRECLLKTDIVMMEEITENKEYWVYAGHEMYDPYRVFGVYHSKERALEVLEEIQNFLIIKYAISLNYKDAFSAGFTKEEAQKILEQASVYEMPKE